MVFDTGAEISTCHKRLFKEHNVRVHQVEGPKNVAFTAANGELIGTGQFVNISIDMVELPFEVNLKTVLVLDDESSPTTLLMGIRDMKRNGVNIDVRKDELVFPEDFRIQYRQAQSHVRPARAHVQKREKGTSPDAPNSYAEAVKSDVHPNVDEYQIDARDKYERRMEAMLAERKQTFTTGEVNWNPELLQKDPELRTEFEGIMSDHKRVFSDTIGRAPERYAARVVYEGRLDPRAPLTKNTPAEKEAICKHLDEEFCNGVLVFPDKHNVRVENFLRILCVAKKDDNGRVLSWSEGMRLVVACNESLNPVTKVPPMKTDDLRETQRRALQASKDPYCMKCDVKKAFLQVPRPKEDWGKTCIDHPVYGTMCYTACVMGWVGSMGIVRNTFQQMFADFDSWMFRFMDDIYLTAPNRETFIKRFRSLVATLDYNNLRLSGKKMFIGGTSMNFVGAKIGDGKMEASPHQGLKALSYTPEDLTTVASIRSFVAFVNHLAKFIHRSVDVLKPFHELTRREGTEKVPWDEKDGKLRKDFETLKSAFRKMATLHAFNEDLTPYIFVDSSAIGQGAILCQKKPEGGFVPIEFYSRAKVGKERKTAVSSCVMEVAGLSGAVEAFRHYLESTKKTCVVFTDSKSLTSIAQRIARGLKPSDVNLINRFFANMIGLRLQVVHLAGKTPEIEMVDYISRTQQDPCQDEENCQVCKMAKVDVAEPLFVEGVAQVCQVAYKTLSMAKTSSTPEVQGVEATKAEVEKAESLKSMPHYTVKWRHPENPKPRYIVAPITANKFALLTVQELIEHPSAIPVMQDQLVHVVKAKKHILSGATLPPKGKGVAKARTLLHTLGAKLTENHILWYPRQIGLEEAMVIPLPAESADVAFGVIHNTYGHRSATQLYQFMRRHFDLPNARQWVVSYSRRCAECAQHGRNKTRMPIPSRAIPEPTRPGEVVYADEVQRTYKGRPLKFLFVTDGLTRYGISVPFEGSMNSQTFVEAILNAVQTLGTLGAKENSLIVRTDGMTAHTSADTRAALEKHNVTIEVHQSRSGSKNLIPAQDARIKTLQNQITIELNKGISPKLAIYRATVEYNRALTDTTLTPAEMLFRRSQATKAELKVTDEELRERILTERAKQREVDDRAEERRLPLPALEIIRESSPEYSRWKEMSPLERENSSIRVLKVGDLVKINKQIQKLEIKLWKVISIDWEGKCFKAKKATVTRETARTIREYRFDAINEVITDQVRRITGAVRVASLEQRRRRMAMMGCGVDLDLGAPDPAYSVYEVEEVNERHFAGLDDSGNPKTPHDFEEEETFYQPSLDPVPEDEVERNWEPQNPGTSSPNPETWLEKWEAQSMASTIEPLNESDLDIMSMSLDESNYLTPESSFRTNEDVDQTMNSVENDTQVNILADQLEKTVTITPKPQRAAKAEAKEVIRKIYEPRSKKVAKRKHRADPLTPREPKKPRRNGRPNRKGKTEPKPASWESFGYEELGSQEELGETVLSFLNSTGED